MLLTTSTAMLVSHLAQMPPLEFAAGITLSMMAPFLMREPTVRQRLHTLFALLLPAAAATALTALLHNHGPAGDSCFLALVFVCFLFHPRHPRMIGVGLVAVVITYVGLYLELPPATLPTQLLSLVMAVPITALACFVAVPMNPAATLRRMVTAVQWRAAQVLHSAHAATDDADATGASMRRLRRDLVRLNEAALVADDQLTLLRPDGRDAVRAGLTNLVLTTASLIEAVRGAKPGPRQTVRLMLHGRRMRRGHRYVMQPDRLERGSLLAALVDLGHAVHALGVAARAMVPTTEATAAASLPPGPLAWTLATRVTLAATLAMAGGMALSPQRWFWAVMTVYVVFLNARSRGDTIHKGVQRLGGTVLGIASGLVLATVLDGHAGLQVLALLLSIFGMYYWFLLSYTAGIFCVTVMLGLLYGMLGASLETLLVLRLEETAIGAAAAMLVAAFVVPTRTRHQVVKSGQGVLAALTEAVRFSQQALSGRTKASPMDVVRRVDQQVADLRLALAPLTAGRILLRRTALERPVPALLDCVHWTRVLAAASHDCTGMPQAEALIAQAARIESRLAALAAPDAHGPKQAAAIAPGLDRPARPVHPNDIRSVLDNLEAAVASLAVRLEIGALEGFALDA